MYYICKDRFDEKPNYWYPEGKIVNITKMSQLIRLREEYKTIKLVDYTIETIVPSSMKQAYKSQTFILKTIDGRELSLFNGRTFKNLYKIFQNPDVIVYKTGWGTELRDSIIGYINKETGKKVLF